MGRAGETLDFSPDSYREQILDFRFIIEIDF